MIEASQVDARDFLRHSLATVAYRGGKALRGAPAEFGPFRFEGNNRTPSVILAHMCDLFDWALSIARGAEAWCESRPAAWDSDVERFFKALAALDQHLKSPGSLACPWARLFQGPIADALTHIGQLAMLRRLAGTPMRGENYFKAEITAGHLGSDQAAPRREFD